MTTTPKLLRVDQVAETLAVHKNTVYRLISEGELIAHRAFRGKKGLRVIAESVTAYLEKYTVKPEAWQK